MWLQFRKKLAFISKFYTNAIYLPKREKIVLKSLNFPITKISIIQVSIPIYTGSIRFTSHPKFNEYLKAVNPA